MAVLYRHLKPNGETFYIGISTNKKRPYSKDSRSNYWKNIVSKYGYEVQILKSNLTWKDACELEIILISYYGRRDLNTGDLVNLTDGGEGTLGYICTDEYRENMRLIKSGEGSYWLGKTGELSSWWGKKHTEDTKKKMSIAGKGRVFSNGHCANLKKSALIRNLTGDKNSRAKRVINTVTKKEYSCVKYAADETGLNYNTLAGYLVGDRPNKTNLMYLEDYNKLNIL